MLLGVIPMFCFGILRFFEKKLQKKQNLENLGINGLQRQGLGYPHRDKAEVPKWHPSSTPTRSISAPRRRNVANVHNKHF